MNYPELLKNPLWQKKRLKIMNRDNFKCKNCGSEDNTLMVHHKKYIKGRLPWEYADSLLITYCENCHTMKHSGLEFIKNRWLIMFLCDFWTFIVISVKVITRKITNKPQSWIL